MNANIETSEATSAILESISDGVFSVDKDWRIISFNRAAEEITGLPRAHALGRPCSEVFQAAFCASGCALRKTMETGHPLINETTWIVRADGRRIPISISTALLRDRSGKVAGGVETFRDLSLIEELRRELTGRVEVGDMISRSPPMRSIMGLVPQIGASEAPVLIQGETGTGKELLARAIHMASPRSDKPFVAVNCGALPDTLLESELFGYRAGAFTGAARNKPGRFSLAEGGTIFLDEIGDISPALQVRLLRVLQEKVYEPLGGTKAVPTDVRVISATNKDMNVLVRQGAVRQDLFYRINVVQLEIPPLRERREDIPILCEHFVNRFNRLQGKTVEGVSPEVLSVFMSYDFPGNIRELNHIIEHAFVLVKDGFISPVALPKQLLEFQPKGDAKSSRKPLLKIVEAQVIRDALARNNNKRLATARELGMHKSTLFRKLRSLGIQ